MGPSPEGNNSRCRVSGVALNAPKPDENPKRNVEEKNTRQ